MFATGFRSLLGRSLLTLSREAVRGVARAIFLGGGGGKRKSAQLGLVRKRRCRQPGSLACPGDAARCIDVGQ